jgi:general transcription factor 3C polypeptide 3 (transcription factor C subunit 4)
MAPLPLDLTFMSAIARVRGGHPPEKFRAQISYLLESNPSEWFHQLLELSEAFYSVGLFNDAISVLEHIQTAPEHNGPNIWSRLADSNHKLGSLQRAIHFWSMCFSHDKTNVEACLALSQIYDELGQIDKGIAVVNELERATGSSLFSSHRSTTSQSSSSNAMAVTGASMEVDASESRFETTAKTYVEKETRIKIAVAKARLFFQKGDYQEFIELLRPILSDHEILFYRKKRRTKRKADSSEEAIALASATSRRKSAKGRKNDTPSFEGNLGSGISAVNNTIEVEDMNEEDYQVENEEIIDEEMEEIPVALPRGRGRPPGTGKKRKRVEFEPTTTTHHYDQLGDAEMVTYETGRQGWALPNESRLKEMQSRRNLWELFGMKEFAIVLSDFCKCVIFQKCANMELFRVIETAYTLVSDECDIILLPASLRSDLRFHVAQVAYEVQLFSLSTQLMRLVCHSNPNNPHTWNFFFKGVSRTREFYVSRGFTTRLVAKHPDCVPLLLLTGHLSQMAGSYQYAIASYLKAYQLDSSLPSTLLCSAVSHISRSMSRSNPNRNGCVLKAFAFFYRYFLENVWGVGACKHEAYFNLARAFHQLSLYHYAIPLYEEVLKQKNLPDMVYDTDKDQFVGHLQREAAYNLALIYRASGAHHLARRMLQNYLTI